MELNQQITSSQDLETTTSQELVLAPEVIESIEILQLPSTDLRAFIQSELESNPTLELQDDILDNDLPEEDQPDEFDDERLIEKMEDQHGRNETFTGYNQEAADRKMEALYNTPAEDNAFQEDILEEIRLSEGSEKTRGIAEYFAYSLDENGYVQVDLDEAVDLLNEQIRDQAEEFLDRVQRRLEAEDNPEAALETLRQEVRNDEHGEMKQRLLSFLNDDGSLQKPREELFQLEQVTEEEAENALELIQQVGPDGLGARDKKECYLLQLDEGDPDYETKKEAIETCLDDLVENDLKKASRELNMDVQEVKDIAEDLRSLDDAPGQQMSSEAAREVTPDVIVRKVDGEYEVEMNDSFVPEVAVSRKYLDLLRDDSLSTEAKDYVKKKIKSAKNLKSSIQQRRETIKSVAEEIVDRQEEFLNKGVNYLRPLKMEEVADEIGCHLSTVSRATDGKYMQTPWKVMPMKGFFTQGTGSSDDGKGQSRISVMNRIKNIVDNEDKSDPLSDSAIADRLEEKHDIDISRRTVNKYRKELDIPSSTKRRAY